MAIYRHIGLLDRIFTLNRLYVELIALWAGDSAGLELIMSGKMAMEATWLCHDFANLSLMLGYSITLLSPLPTVSECREQAISDY